MGLFSRLKKLWELTDGTTENSHTFPAHFDGNGLVLGEKPNKPIGMATVVQDDPLDIFNDNGTNEQDIHNGGGDGDESSPEETAG